MYNGSLLHSLLAVNENDLSIHSVNIRLYQVTSLTHQLNSNKSAMYYGPIDLKTFKNQYQSLVITPGGVLPTSYIGMCRPIG